VHIKLSKTPFSKHQSDWFKTALAEPTSSNKLCSSLVGNMFCNRMNFVLHFWKIKLYMRMAEEAMHMFIWTSMIVFDRGIFTLWFVFHTFEILSMNLLKYENRLINLCRVIANFSMLDIQQEHYTGSSQYMYMFWNQ
jgi:hypothetical protein